MTAALLAVALLIVGWFALGSIVNVRKGHAAMRWLQGGLPLIGKRTTVRWLGTTSVVLTIAEAQPPFEQATLVVFLEARDVPWLWALSHARGRRDTLIVRAQLRHEPTEEVVLLDRRSWSGRDALRRMSGARWSVREPAAGAELATYYKFERALGVADAMMPAARGAGIKVRRLALRRGQPNFEVHADLPGGSAAAGEFFAALRAMADRAAQA